MSTLRSETHTPTAHMTTIDPTTPAAIRDAIAPVLDDLKASAAHRDADREHPYEEIRRLAEAGLLRFRVPRRDGGAGATTRELVELIRDIAAADSNVAQALRPGFLVADGLATGSLKGQSHERVLARVLAGDLFAGTRNEITGQPGGIATRLTLRDGRIVVKGEKYYSTGALHARWFSGNAVDDEGAEVNFTVDVETPGVERRDDFDAVGQRLTASGTTVLDDVEIEPEDVASAEGVREHPHGTLPHLILAATLAGIAQAAHDDAVVAARDLARPIKHSSAQRSVDDPYVRLSVGQISAAAFAASAVAESAADRLDAYWSGPSHDRAIAATVATAHAFTHAGEQALRAGELVFDTGGGRLTGREHGLDRHWRNARTVLNHNPRHWKYAAAGAWSLIDEEPPSNGLF